ncbi:NADPH:quinone reductase-like Zn-dependent oxidoreductase [Nocardia tenerifensis]|uniref:NADPH:quinone reductase-like Zn-dependent oxidoreductase n=1 Tax=Nocardia tenerifensis TaxID=228006 RepID=A0A318K9G2_9NOCA|nr:NADPH:quinone oxidoreductase family protein [Nocardia tenerifensis]PXX70958.1 NADPH:quinone reductase-like Zn-dependent oxidoreductase [Nocardia tenerifensis]
MKAWQITETGEPGTALHWTELDNPAPGHGQMLVRVAAAAANFPDVLLCRGEYQVKPALPFTPGLELCGKIVALGAGCERFRVGDRVVGTPVMPHGAFAELSVLDADGACPAPPDLSDAEAAALTIGYQTAWFALHRRTRLAAHETLLVHAAAGGVGSAAVQLGKAAGARVIGVVGGPGKADYCRRLGADLVLDRHSDDLVAAIKNYTDGRGADVVFDPVGGEAYTTSAKCVAFEGRIVVVGFASGAIPAPALNHALIKNYSIIGLHWGLYKGRDPRLVQDCHHELTRLAATGAVKPLISERLSLSHVPDALARLGAGSTVGRIVFHP